jgi:hypothetical protein
LIRGTSQEEDGLVTSDERIAFTVGQSSFVLAQRDFVSAELLAGNSDLLVIQLGGCEVTVGRPVSRSFAE